MLGVASLYGLAWRRTIQIWDATCGEERWQTTVRRRSSRGRHNAGKRDTWLASDPGPSRGMIREGTFYGVYVGHCIGRGGKKEGSEATNPQPSTLNPAYDPLCVCRRGVGP